MKQAKYENIRNQLKTGDILLFSGKGFISWGIKRICGSKWSHVGMVIKVNGYDMVFCWESTSMSSIKDFFSKKQKNGAQTVLLSDRLRVYPGQVAVRQLKTPLKPQQINAIMQLRKECKNKPYETNKWELFCAAYDFIGGKNKKNLRSVFCSEMTAEGYIRAGLLKSKKPSNEYEPCEFASMKLIGNELSQEIYLKA